MKVTKIKFKQSKMPVCTEDLDKAIVEVTGTFDGVEEICVEPTEGIVSYIQRRDIAVPVTLLFQLLPGIWGW